MIRYMLGVVTDGRCSNNNLLVACVCLHGHIQLHLQEGKKAFHAIDCWCFKFWMVDSRSYHVRRQLGTHCMADSRLFHPCIQSIHSWRFQKAAVLCSCGRSLYYWFIWSLFYYIL